MTKKTVQKFTPEQIELIEKIIEEKIKALEINIRSVNDYYSSGAEVSLKYQGKIFSRDEITLRTD